VKVVLFVSLLQVFRCLRQLNESSTASQEHVFGVLKIAKELGTFPSIAILLQIYATLTVTAATSE